MTQKRPSRAATSQGVQLGLIITPMLDMSFQLLAFFIMTYHPSALEAHIPGSLAPPENPAHHANDVVPPPEPALPADPDVFDGPAATIKIKAVAKGQEIGNQIEGLPSQLFLKLPLETEERLIADINGNFAAALKRLNAELMELVRNGTVGKANLKIAADGEVRQQYVIRIYDAARKAGFDKIHFVPPPVLNTKINTR